MSLAWTSFQLGQDLFQAIHPVVLLVRERRSELLIPLLNPRNQISFGFAQVTAEISPCILSGLTEVLVIGIDLKRLLECSQPLLLASLFLCNSALDKALPSFFVFVNHTFGFGFGVLYAYGFGRAAV